MTGFPQVLINVRMDDKQKVAESADIAAAEAIAEEAFAEDGCVLLCPSGTETVAHVMVVVLESRQPKLT